MGKKIASVFFPTGNARDDALRRRLEQAGETTARLRSEELLDRLDRASRRLDVTLRWVKQQKQAATRQHRPESTNWLPIDALPIAAAMRAHLSTRYGRGAVGRVTDNAVIVRRSGTFTVPTR